MPFLKKDIEWARRRGPLVLDGVAQLFWLGQLEQNSKACRCYFYHPLLSQHWGLTLFLICHQAVNH